ncbi:cadherin-like beta sandwich domain-containing protein [Clostridia bacterium]|nr:cadherin-like beta sandwich domain-containing protein [Clostridia bacterium]
MTIGALALDPVFDAETLAYAVATTNATNVITATTDDPSAVIDIDLNGEPHVNGEAASWEAGENIVTITVTDGESETEYVVTVTKS